MGNVIGKMYTILESIFAFICEIVTYPFKLLAALVLTVFDACCELVKKLFFHRKLIQNSIHYTEAHDRRMIAGKIPLALTSLNLKGPSNTPGRSYDFIIPFDNVSSIQVGWPVIFSPEASEYLGKPESLFRNLQIVGILGYYSKGKSFLLNRLYSVATVSDIDTQVSEGLSVTTKAFSGLFVTQNDIEHSNLLVIDTSGRNAPAIRSKEVSSDANELKLQIDEIRGKERLIDDVIVDIADTIIYVVDEVLNEDQRTLLHLVKKICEQNRAQKLILVHNFKRVDFKNCQNLIKDQIIDAFGASKHFLTPADKKIYGSSFQVWDSNYPVLNNPNNYTVVMHFALFNQANSADYNNNVFKFLHTFITTPRGQMRCQNPVDRVCQSIADHLPAVLKVTDLPGEEVANDPYVSVEEASMVLRLPTKKNVQLLPWELLQLPNQETQSDWTPSSNHYILENKLYCARIDLPGFSNDHFLKDPPVDGTAKTWWCARLDRSDSNQHYFFYNFYGHRSTALEGDLLFGKFHVQFEIPYRYRNDLNFQLANGILILTGRDTDANRESKEEKGIE